VVSAGILQEFCGAVSGPFRRGEVRVEPLVVGVVCGSGGLGCGVEGRMSEAIEGEFDGLLRSMESGEGTGGLCCYLVECGRGVLLRGRCAIRAG